MSKIDINSDDLSEEDKEKLLKAFENFEKSGCIRESRVERLKKKISQIFG